MKKYTLSLRNRCSLFRIKAWLVEQAKNNMDASDTSEVTKETPSDPGSEVAEDHPMKDIIK